MKLDVHKTGLALGAFLGLWHLMWACLVAIGWARPLLDFIFYLHFLNFTYSLSEFSVAVAAQLVAVTFMVGYVSGLILALLWNRSVD